MDVPSHNTITTHIIISHLLSPLARPLVDRRGRARLGEGEGAENGEGRISEGLR